MEAILFPKTIFVHKTQIFIPNGASSRYNTQTRRLRVLKSEQMALTRQLFDEMPSTDAFAWNSLIRSNLGSGNLHHVVSIYQEMLSRGVRPDKHTLPRLLAASRRLKSLYFGKQLHGHAVKFGLSSEEYVITALMELYDHLDCLSAVKSLLDNPVAQSSCVPWTLLIRMHMRNENPRMAIDVFYQMVGLRVTVDSLAGMAAIGACSMLRSLQEGRKIHDIAQVSGLDSDVLVSNSLLKMYLDCGSVEDARKVFNRMVAKDVISWTEMIRGYVKNGGFNEGLKLFKNMLLEGIRPDNHSISSILPSCARMTAHKQGRQIHGFLIRNNFDLNLTLKNALMDMYVKSGFPEYASKILTQMAFKDAVSWTIIIHGYSLHGQGARGVELFREVQETGQLTWLRKEPEVRHCALMVSLLARAGLFDEAKEFIKEKHIENNREVLRALLNGCKVHKETQMAKEVTEQRALSNQNMGLGPKKAYSWIEFHNKVHVFGTEDVSHPRSDMIYEELQGLVKKSEEMKRLISQEDFGFHEELWISPLQYQCV
ncbi:hypothetical protein V2J09_005884 [Rumex salicifolius]